jgi:peptidyl-prolyl cis-trans isomerase D
VDENGNDPDGKPVTLPFASAEILKTVFATSRGDTSRITDTQDGAIYAVQVDKVMPPQPRPLADVKDKAITAWQAEQKQERAKKDAEALAVAVKPEMPLAKAAGDKGLTLLAAVALSRRPQQGQPVPPAVVAKLFAGKPGDVVTASDGAGSYVAQLKEIQAPEEVPEAAGAALQQQLSGEVKRDLAGEFTAALRRRFPVEIKQAELDRLF